MKFKLEEMLESRDVDKDIDRLREQERVDGRSEPKLTGGNKKVVKFDDED
jgi:hypothetical protein